MIAGVPYDAEVEYLESTGTQWIDTGIIFDADNGFSITYSPTNSDTNVDNGSIFGSRTTDGNTRMMVGLNANTAETTGVGCKVYIGWGVLAIPATPSRVARIGSWYTATANISTATATDGLGATASLSALPTQTRTAYIFAANTQNGPLLCRSCIAACKIYQNAVLVRDYIPVRKGTVGYLYDRVTRKLFGNQGTGAFVIGPDVAKPVMGLHFYGMPLSARDYVQDGLVAMWDGIENAGWGVHDPNATVWTDLVGNRDFTIVNPSWRDKGLFFGGNGTTYGYLSQSDSAIFDSPPSITISAVITRGGENWSSDGIYLKPADSGRYGLAFFVLNFTIRNVVGYNSYVFPQENSVSVSVSYNANSNTVTPRYGNTICVPHGIPNSIGQSQTYATIGRRTVGTTYYAKGTMHTLRLYSRALSADEIAHNYAIDRVRFNLPEVTA